jgi:toxin HigB-1
MQLTGEKPDASILAPDSFIVSLAGSGTLDTYNVIHYTRVRQSLETGRTHETSVGIVSFADAGTEDIFDGQPSRRARKTCPETIWNVARRKLDQLNAATKLSDLGFPPNNRLEALKGDRKGQHSIRINDQYRICFVWREQGPDEVAIVDYH